jgi:hypothetical protein
LQQLDKRIKELNTVNHIMENSEQIGPMRPFPGNTRAYHGYKFNQFTIKTTKADSCCHIKATTEEFPFLVSSFQEINGIMHVCGQRYINLESFDKTFFDSAEVLGILKGNQLSLQIESYPVSYISFKYVRLPLNVRGTIKMAQFDSMLFFINLDFLIISKILNIIRRYFG